jgi:hypothetical protein
MSRTIRTETDSYRFTLSEGHSSTAPFAHRDRDLIRSASLASGTIGVALAAISGSIEMNASARNLHTAMYSASNVESHPFALSQTFMQCDATHGRRATEFSTWGCRISRSPWFRQLVGTRG